MALFTVRLHCLPSNQHTRLLNRYLIRAFLFYFLHITVNSYNLRDLIADVSPNCLATTTASDQHLVELARSASAQQQLAFYATESLLLYFHSFHSFHDTLTSPGTCRLTADVIDISAAILAPSSFSDLSHRSSACPCLPVCLSTSSATQRLPRTYFWPRDQPTGNNFSCS